MNDKAKTILCFVLILVAIVIYLVCACLPPLDELKERFSKNKNKNITNNKK